MKNPLKTKLRIRFILLAMVSLAILQSIIVGVSIYNNYNDLAVKSDMLISQLHSNPTGSSRYFSIKIPAGKDTVFPDVVQHVSITADEAVAFAREALAQHREKGFISGYRYHLYQNENGTKIYFLSRDSGIEMCQTAAKNMICVSLLGLTGIGLILIPISGWVVKPLVENHRKQKQFITSASHELKTPLTVISTNAQLLQLEIGDNQWLSGIQDQVAHLTQMTHDLVELSKAEEYDNPVIRENFCLSDALQNIIEIYESIAKQKCIQFGSSIQPDLSYCGSKAEILQLLQILLDNACKYCPQEGHIYVKAKQSFHGIQIHVTNTTAQVKSDNAQALLLRFNRGQNAAGITGSGLGLSIAEAIINRHNGHLAVSTGTEDEFCVEVVLR